MFNKVAEDEGVDYRISATDIKTLKWHNDKANCSCAIVVKGLTKLLSYQEELRKYGVNFLDDICKIYDKGYLEISFGYIATAAKSCELFVSKADPVCTTVANPHDLQLLTTRESNIK